LKKTLAGMVSAETEGDRIRPKPEERKVMERVSEVLKDKGLKPEELGGKPHIVTIDGVEWVTYDDGRKTRLTFDFKGEERERTMNKTNMRELVRMFSDDPLDWVGREVTLIPTRVAFKDKIVPTIIVAEATAKATAKAQSAPKPPQSTPKPPQSAPPAPDPSDPGPGDDHFAGIVSDDLPDWRAS
jgi:hypothetical protein